jgi:hypothetical protein
LLWLGALGPFGLQALEPAWYVGGAWGQKVTAGPLGLQVEDQLGGVESDDASYKAFGGLQLGPYFAVEASYQSFGAQRFTGGFGDFVFDVDVEGYAAAAVGTWPIGRVTVFGKAGSFWWNEEGSAFGLIGNLPISEEGRDLVLGAGAKVEITRHWRVRGEWERFEFGDRDADDLWVGVEFQF